MITAKEAAEIIKQQKEKQLKLIEEAERIYQLIQEGKYIPESNCSVKDVEKLIKKDIELNKDTTVIQDKLKDDVVKILKENGWYCYLYNFSPLDYTGHNRKVSYYYQTIISIYPNPNLPTEFQFIKEL